jgi:hypothetical protein
LIGKEEIRSDAGFVDELRGYPRKISLIDEFGKLFGKASGARASSWEAGIKSAFLKMYNKDVFMAEAIRGREQGENIHNPHLALCGTCTHEEFYNLLKAKDVSDGFINRFIIFDLGEKANPSRRKTIDSTYVPTFLLEKLKQITTRENDMGVPNQAIIYERMQATQKCMDMFFDFQAAMEQIDDVVKRAFYGRAAENAQKLAMLRALSLKPTDPCMTEYDLKWGIDVMEFSIGIAWRMFKDKVSANKVEEEYKYVLEQLKRIHQNKSVIAQRDLFRCCQRVSSRNLKDIISRMAEEEKIVITSQKQEGKGRPKKMISIVDLD